jgi:murein DD-endopeptidase MepM/ murein hydrolase activator NlpD
MYHRTRNRLTTFILLVSAAAFIFWLFNDTISIMRLVFQQAPEMLRVPVVGVSPTQLHDTWGARRSLGRQHQGIDIFAPKGTPVISTTPGIVQRIGQNRLGGNCVWILGPSGQVHYYAHLDQFADIQPSQKIEPGDVIGYVGNSGNAKTTPSHLHYCIYTFFGEAVNPFPLLHRTSVVSMQFVPSSILPLMLLLLLFKPRRN